MKKIMNIKKTVARLLVTAMAVCTLSNPLTVFAAENETVNTETTTVSGNELSLEDLLGKVDNTNKVVEEEVYATLNLNIPASVVVSRDGIALLSMEQSVMLADGTVTLSQPVADEYYNRIESDVTITISAGVITVTFEGQTVNGSVTDALGNTVSFDGTTLTILNSQKLEDTVVPPSEEDDDVVIIPEEQPAAYTVNYYVNSVAVENLLNTEEITSIVGATIDVAAIELNAHKPTDTATLKYLDGVMVEYATTVTADDSDVINIVYLTEEVVIYGDYTVNYYVDSVEESNLLHRDVISAELGSEIDVNAIELNTYKPESTETKLYLDGVMVDVANIVTEDDSDVINIVYTSETVEIAGNADFTVKYYQDALQDINFLGETTVNGTSGQSIDYSTVDLEMFCPANYGNGEIQTVVSATVVAEDNSDVVYVLYTKVEKELQIVTETLTLPGETEYVYITETKTETIKEKEYIEVPGEKEYIYLPGKTEYVYETQYIETPGEKEYIYLPGEKEIIKEKEYIEVPGEKEYIYIEVPTEEEDEDIPITPEENKDPEPEYDEDTPINPEDRPQTGDESTIFIFMILAIVSLFGLALTTKKEKVAKN